MGKKGAFLMHSRRFDYQFLAVVVLMLSAALVLEARSQKEIIAPREALASFPTRLTTWTGSDVPMDKETLDILGPGDFLLRLYQNQVTDEPTVDLFIAYFPSQRTGDTIHSPKHCLPGSGWRPVDARHTSLALPGRRPFPVNRYLIARGDDRELVYYWYQAHDRELASEYWAKFYLIADAIRMNRSDGALVRLATPLVPHEGVEKADARIMALAEQVVPQLDRYVPR